MQFLFTRPLDQVRQHVHEFLDGFASAQVFFIGVAPMLALPDRSLCECRIALDVEFHHAGANVCAADVRGQNRIVAFEYP
jgi:hypothetical protein